MLKRWISRYHPHYPRSLVYMLQASEYHIEDYLHWYHKVKDFRYVEQRKHFVKTGKSVLLLIIAWVLAIFLYGFSIKHFVLAEIFPVRIISLAGILLTPYLLAYLILIPLLIIRIVVQKPIEYFIVKQAKDTIKKHKGIKIGIAGSFGKTTMREMLKIVLAEGKQVVAPPHSYNTPLGISQFVKSLKGDEEIIIFELGEYYPGDVRKLCKLVQPDLGIITGINEAHLQKFTTLAKTAKTIYELADYLGDKPVWINGDSELALRYAKPEHHIYSQKGVDSWKVQDAESNLEGTTFSLTNGKDKLQLRSQLLGLHQVGPLSAVVAIANYLGLTDKQIEAGIAKTKAFDHRLEPKIDASGIITLDDSYNGNPNGVAAVIKFLGSLHSHRRFYVTPGLVEMGSRKDEVHLAIGEQLAAAKIEHVVLIKNSVTPYIEKGLKQAGYQGQIIWFDNALAAFAALPYLTIKDDIVLLQNDWPDQYQ